MPKGSRRQVGKFKVNDRVIAGGEPGRIAVFPTRRIALVLLDTGKTVQVSILELEHETSSK